MKIELSLRCFNRDLKIQEFLQNIKWKECKICKIMFPTHHPVFLHVNFYSPVSNFNLISQYSTLSSLFWNLNTEWENLLVHKNFQTLIDETQHFQKYIKNIL